MGPLLFQFYIYNTYIHGTKIFYTTIIFLYHPAVELINYLRCISRLDAKTAFVRYIQDKVGFGATHIFLSRYHKWSNLVYILRLVKRVACGNRTVCENIPPSNCEKRCGERCPWFRNFTVFLQFFYSYVISSARSFFSPIPPLILAHRTTQRALGNEYLRRTSLRPRVPARKPPRTEFTAFSCASQ